MIEEINNFVKQEMKKHKKEYIDFFSFWIKEDEKVLDETIFKLINNIDFNNIIDAWQKNKVGLLPYNKLYIQKKLSHEQNYYNTFDIDFKQLMLSKVKNRNVNIDLFNDIYNNYFSQFTTTELLNNKSNKSNSKISKGLKNTSLSQKQLRQFQDIYSEIIQEYSFSKKEDIIIEISIKPIDFLTMSYNPDYCWSTCQNFLTGEHGIGVIPYMCDKNTVIVQAYFEKEKDKLVKNKLWRCLGFLSDNKNVLTLSTEYPCNNIVFREETFNLLKKKQSKVDMLPLYCNENDLSSFDFNTKNQNFKYNFWTDDFSFCDYKAGNMKKEGVPALFINKEENDFVIKVNDTDNNLNYYEALPYNDMIYQESEETELSPTYGLLTADLIVDNL